MTKQIRDVDVDHHHNIAIANCLMLLSHQGAQFVETSSIIPSSHHDHHQRVFECKTCNRQFPSFQALGGHRASHKKLRIPIGGGGSVGEADDYDYGGKANKTHECSICGLEFAIGQALGGHMRRHRAESNNNNNNNNNHIKMHSFITTSSNSSSSVDSESNEKEKKKKRKRSVLVLDLDLNLTPLENDLEFLKINNNNGKPISHPFEISFSF